MAAISQDKQERKNAPMARGFLDYFPAAVAGVAECSRIANEQHNPGEEMHWARDKSSDHADCILRHLVERDSVDEDGIPHVVKVAWRAMALAQEYFEAQGATPGRASKWQAQENAQEAVQTSEWVPREGDNVSVVYESEKWIGVILETDPTDSSLPYRVSHPTVGYQWVSNVALINAEG